MYYKWSKEFLEAGKLKPAAGTDCWVNTSREQAVVNELRNLVAYGCSPMQAIQAATGWASEAMGWEDIGTLAPGWAAEAMGWEDIGTLAPGKLADLLPLTETPWRISRR